MPGIGKIGTDPQNIHNIVYDGQLVGFTFVGDNPFAQFFLKRNRGGEPAYLVTGYVDNDENFKEEILKVQAILGKIKNVDGIYSPGSTPSRSIKLTDEYDCEFLFETSDEVVE